MTETVNMADCLRVAISQTRGVIARLQGGREDASALLRAALGNAQILADDAGETDDNAVAMLNAAIKAHGQGNDVSAASFAKVALERLEAYPGA